MNSLIGLSDDYEYSFSGFGKELKLEYVFFCNKFLGMPKNEIEDYIKIHQFKIKIVFCFITDFQQTSPVNDTVYFIYNDFVSQKIVSINV